MSHIPHYYLICDGPKKDVIQNFAKKCNKGTACIQKNLKNYESGLSNGRKELQN
jgi:hypothetical protein